MFAVVVQSVSHVWLFMTPQTAARQAPLSSTISRSLLRFKSIELVMLSNHLIPCCPFSFRLQSFPASESFPMRQLFASGGQSIGASASASVIPMNIQGWFPLGLTDLISQQSRTTIQSTNSLVLSLLYGSTLTSIYNYWKDHSFNYIDFCWQSDVSAFNMLSRFVIAFLPRSNCLLISWLSHHPQWYWSPKK